MSKNIFTDQELNSNDGMLTSVWGPALWHSLHTISFNYPVHPTAEQKKQYKEFVLSLQNVLPCGACRKNLVKNLQDVPLTPYALSNRKNFSRWMYRLHERVNEMLGKKSGLTYNDVAQRYENFRARCKQNKPEPPKKKEKKGGKEDGCTQPITGLKSKCIINIVPQSKEHSTPSFNMDEKCYQRRV